MKKTLANSFDLRFVFVFAVFAIFFFLSVGMPTPPGLLYKVSESYLQSQPGYYDIKTGSINPALLEQNVDSYNSYLLSVVIIIVLNLIIYYALFVLSTVVVWNYLQKKTLSVAGYWRSFLFNIAWLLLAAFLAFISYTVFMFIGSIGPQLWQIIMATLFAVSIALLIVATMLFNYHLQKSSMFLESFIEGLHSMRTYFWKLVAGVLITFAVVFLASFLFYIPSISFMLVTAIVTLVQLVGFAWLHVYVYELLSIGKKKI